MVGVPAGEKPEPRERGDEEVMLSRLEFLVKGQRKEESDIGQTSVEGGEGHGSNKDLSW